MKHLKKGRKFGRKKDQRQAMLRNLLGELLIRQKITTTEAKAKEIKGIAEKIINNSKKSLVKEKDARVAALRYLAARLPKNMTVKKIEEIAKSFSSRKSGYVRITKAGQRKSDGARTAIIELIKDVTSL